MAESGVPEAGERLRGLLRATQAIVGDLSIDAVLQRIVESACELLGARYGALGVIDPEGRGLERFVHVGLDESAVRRIGELPEGKGVLGALIDDPRAIALAEIADDPRSVGFPDHHPPMRSFLGVPISVRGTVFGNLYLTEAASGEFSDEDVELARSLAATAAVAIENARLFEDSQRREEWLQASTSTTVRILSSGAENVLGLIAETVHRLAEADVVTLVVPTADSRRLTVRAAVGEAADSLMESSYALDGTLTEVVLATGEPVRLSSPEEAGGHIYLRDVVEVGPLMVLPLAGREDARGTLVVARLAGRACFRAGDLEMATAFASQAALALELADARRDAQRIAILEDRDRIARDLHDHVIQQLFAAGMSLQALGMRLGNSPEGQRVERVVDSLDGSITQIRDSIFHLRDHLGPQGLGIRSAVLETVAELAAGLPEQPEVRFSGPVDTVVDQGLADDVLAVVREALTNVARHAQAETAEISISATRTLLELRVADDGRGIGATTRRSGLDNLRVRAEKRGGTLTLEELRPGVGTVVRWQVPVDLSDQHVT